MKFIHTLGLMGVMLTVGGVAGSQVLNPDVGVPISTAGNVGTATVVLDHR